MATIFLPNKSMWISLQNAQVQFTPQSMVRSGQILISSEINDCPAYKIQSTMKALEWPQHYTPIFQMLKGSLLRSQLLDLADIRTHSR